MNFKNPNITLSKNHMIAGAIILCVLVAIGVFFSARMIAPRSDDQAAGEPADGGATQTPEQQVISRADAAFKAGGDALEAGDTKEAIVQLNEAKKLYEEAGDTTRVEQTVDVISHAEHEAKVEAEQGEGEEQGGSSQGGSSSGGSGDTNGNGIIDEGETAPPQYATIEGDKATREPVQPEN